MTKTTASWGGESNYVCKYTLVSRRTLDVRLLLTKDEGREYALDRSAVYSNVYVSNEDVLGAVWIMVMVMVRELNWGRVLAAFQGQISQCCDGVLVSLRSGLLLMTSCSLLSLPPCEL